MHLHMGKGVGTFCRIDNTHASIELYFSPTSLLRRIVSRYIPRPSTAIFAGLSWAILKRRQHLIRKQIHVHEKVQHQVVKHSPTCHRIRLPGTPRQAPEPRSASITHQPTRPKAIRVRMPQRPPYYMPVSSSRSLASLMPESSATTCVTVSVHGRRPRLASASLRRLSCSTLIRRFLVRGLENCPIFPARSVATLPPKSTRTMVRTSSSLTTATCSATRNK